MLGPLLPSLALLTALAGAPADTTLTLGTRPTLVAFFGVSAAMLEQEPMLEQVLTDFQFSLERARPEIEGLQVDVHEIYDQVIELRTGDGALSVPVTQGLPVGYYFWAPGQPGGHLPGRARGLGRGDGSARLPRGRARRDRGDAQALRAGSVARSLQPRTESPANVSGRPGARVGGAAGPQPCGGR